MNRMTKEERAAAKAEKNALREFRQYPYLLAMKPKERYIFHSDYFDVDGQVGTVLSFFHVDGATDGYPPFWGVGRIPQGRDNDIVTISFEQIRRMSKSWVE